MSSKLPFMPLYVSDYLADTTHLTCEEHGAYMLLLMVMWKAGGSLPNDDVSLARITRLPLARWRKIAPNVLPFFQTSNCVLRNKRVSTEIENAQKISQARSEAGKKGAEAKALKTQEAPSANADGLLKQTQSKGEASHTSHITEITSNSIALDLAPNAAPLEEDKKPLAPYVVLGQRITDLMGVTNDPRWLGNWSQVQIWMAQGYDPELDIWPAVSAKVGQFKQSKRRMPTSLKYFDQIIADHHQARTSGLATSTPGATIETGTVKRGSPEFNAYLEDQRRQGKRTTFLESRDALTLPVSEIEKFRGTG